MGNNFISLCIMLMFLFIPPRDNDWLCLLFSCKKPNNAIVLPQHTQHFWCNVWKVNFVSLAIQLVGFSFSRQTAEQGMVTGQIFLFKRFPIDREKNWNYWNTITAQPQQKSEFVISAIISIIRSSNFLRPTSVFEFISNPRLCMARALDIHQWIWIIELE